MEMEENTSKNLIIMIANISSYEIEDENKYWGLATPHIKMKVKVNNRQRLIIIVENVSSNKNKNPKTASWKDCGSYK